MCVQGWISQRVIKTSLIVVIYPKPTAKRELITKRERARGWFGIKNIVIQKIINNKVWNKEKECKRKSLV